MSSWGEWAQWTVPWSGELLRFEQAEMFVLLALVPTLVVGVFLSLSGLSLAQRLLSLALRMAFFACLIFGMGRPLHEVPSQKICQVVLIDVSRSVSDADLERAREQLLGVSRSLKKSDRLNLLTFAENAREEPLGRDPSGSVVAPNIQALRGEHLGQGSNLQLALERASAYVGSDCHSRFLVLSDGIETRGNALSAVPSLLRKKIRVSVVPLHRAQAQDVAVTAVSTEGEVRVGEPFRVRVELTAAAKGRGQLRLFQGELINGLDGVRTVEVPAGSSAFTFDSVVRVGGEISYRAEYLPQSVDNFKENNQYLTSFDVPGPPRILVVDRRPAQIAHLVDALVAQQFDVEVRAASEFPRSFAEIDQFELVVLSDLSRDDLSLGAESLVERYVRGGGGLLFAGGEASYGPGGWQNSGLEKILPVRMNAQKEREMPGVAMSLVIDRSGSMTGLPLAMAKEACLATVGVLAQNDLIEIIAFDSRPTSYVPLQPARYRLRIEEAVSRIQAGGGTEIFNALDRAYQSLSAVEARRKHIILLTDGNAASDGIYELASTAFAEGITITGVGLGAGVNHSLLTMVAETGGGRFIASDDPARLPRIFTRETELISAKPTLEDWFPISVVKEAEFLSGINLSSAPLLRGYTSTQLAAPPAELILASDRGEPILARRPVGLGWTLAWTSDFKTRWATDFLRFRQFGQLMSQLIRHHQKSDHSAVLPMSVERRGDEVVARVEAFDEQENFENHLVSLLEIRRNQASGSSPGPSAQGKQAASLEVKVPFVAVAPGLYEAAYGLPGPGAYVLRAVHHRVSDSGAQTPAGMSFGTVSLPYPEEYRDLSPKLEQLRTLAQLTGGAFALDEQLPTPRVEGQLLIREGRQQPFILLAIILFFLDLLVRRVRLFERSFIGFRSGSAKNS